MPSRAEANARGGACRGRAGAWVSLGACLTDVTWGGRRAARSARREERRVLVVRERRVTKRSGMDRRPLALGSGSRVVFGSGQGALLGCRLRVRADELGELDAVGAGVPIFGEVHVDAEEGQIGVLLALAEPRLVFAGPEVLQPRLVADERGGAGDRDVPVVL